MGQALYRKYRSKSLDEVVGQEHVTTTLTQALKQHAISHAYLFTGPRGVGKTSVARILAHEINGIPYTDDSMHIDIIEIDAASNRGIDEIRELRDRVYIAPTSAKYKVYIIDEVHMLTIQAFNALLKTLEEPPEHVVFILATTDANKLPDTILSRTQRFHFKPADTNDLIGLIKDISKKEKISIEPDAITLLAKHSDGSYRDCLSLLDQARSYGPKITAETVENLLGIPSEAAIDSIAQLLYGDDPAKLMNELNEYYNQGVQATTIAIQLGAIIRNDIVNKTSLQSRAEQLELLKNLVEVPAAYDPERYLEIVLLKTINLLPTSPKSTNVVKTPAPTLPEQTDTKTVPKKIEEKKVAEVDIEPEIIDAVISPSDIDSNDLWTQVLHALKSKHNTLYGMLRMAIAEFPNDETLTLIFSFAFHEKRVKETVNQKLIVDTVNQLSGKQITIEFILDPTSKNSLTKESATPHLPDDKLSAISNIFSGAELLES